MTRVTLTDTGFTAGELSPLLRGRGDLGAYADGAGRLLNVLVQPTGGVTRRPGLRHVAIAEGPGRLVAFEFNTEQTYLMHFSDGWVDVFAGDVPVAGFATPWSLAELDRLAWTQSADTLLVVHPEVEPRRITRRGAGEWTIEPWRFVERDGRRRMPFHRFADEDVTLAASGTTGTVTLTASDELFVAGHEGARLRLQGRELEISAIVSATEATAEAKETLVGTAPSDDWQEAAFSGAHGWPATAAFHQDRLVIGGSRDLPNRLWMSRAGALFDFDLGDGLDDEAIEFPILSDQVNAIRAVFSGRHLQVFTTGAEWMVTGDPLTPANVQVRRQTRVGSPVARSVPPRDVDGATVFVARSGREVREFAFTDVEQAYQARDLAILARHLVREPVDQDFDARRRVLLLALADGAVVCLTLDRSERVVAWSELVTEGAVRALAVVGDVPHLLTERGGAFAIEALDDRLSADAGAWIESQEPFAEVTGLDWLEGRQVTLVADGALRSPVTVEAGRIELDPPVTTVGLGLAFVHEVAPLAPVAPGGGTSQAATWRLIQAVFRLHDTGALVVDTGLGPQPLPFRRFGEPSPLDAPAPRFTGDVRIAGHGWHRGTAPPWRVAGAEPLPFTLLSVSTKLKVHE